MKFDDKGHKPYFNVKVFPGWRHELHYWFWSDSAKTEEMSCKLVNTNAELHHLREEYVKIVKNNMTLFIDRLYQDRKEIPARHHRFVPWIYKHALEHDWFHNSMLNTETRPFKEPRTPFFRTEEARVEYQCLMGYFVDVEGMEALADVVDKFK